MPPAKSQGRRVERCVFTEGGARCRRSGTGDPSLCNPHRIVMRDAGRPPQPLGGLADLVDRFVSGKRVTAKVWKGAMGDVAAILDQYQQQQGQPQPQQQASAGSGGFRPPPGFTPPPNWGWVPPWARPQPPPPPDPLVLERKRARVVLGLTPTEALTLEILTKRRRELARKHHPDRGGSVAKMQSINAAADVLEAELGPRATTPP